MSNITRFKVDEAIYFLSMMKQTFNNKSNSFSFNLHAFITASRSITLYMQKQYDTCSGFHEWYDQKQIILSSDSELKFLLQARNDAVHKKPVKNMTEYQFKIPVSLPIIPGEDLLKKYYENDELNERELEVNIKRRFFEENKETDIIEFCDNQLNKLTVLVDECESKFKM